MSAFDPKRTFGVFSSPFNGIGYGSTMVRLKPQGEAMRRRDFISLIGGTAATWPLAGRAQQAEPVRHIGVLMPFAAGDPGGRARIVAFQQGLQQLGWSDGAMAAT